MSKLLIKRKWSDSQIDLFFFQFSLSEIKKVMVGALREETAEEKTLG